MKKQVTQLMFAMMGLAVAPMVFAQAAPGTGQVTFNGELYDETCVIDAGDVDKTVTMPTVSAKSLAAVGAVYGSQEFTISVSQCPASAEKVAAHFETTNMNPDTRNAINLAETKKAENVEVRLLNYDGQTQLKLGSTGTFFDVDAVSHEAEMTYYGQYYATAATTAGNVKAIVRYTLAYQ